MSGDGGSMVSLGVYLGADCRVECYEYPDKAPILSIDAGPNTVTMSVKGRDAADATVRFARELAAKAQRFAAEVERVHAAKLAEAAGSGVKCAECGGTVEGTAA